MPGHVHASRPRAAAAEGRGRPEAPGGTPAGGDDPPVGEAWLRRVLDVVGQGPDLDRVLLAVGELLTDATGCDSCVVRLRDPAPEGTGAEPAADGSAVPVPLRGRDGAVLGVAVLRTDPARELGDGPVALAVRLAGLVGDAVQNARRYDEERARVAAADRLAALVARLAAVAGRGDLGRAACDGTLELLRADRCRLQMDLEGGAARVVAQADADADDGGSEPPVDAPERGSLAVRVAAGDAGEGVLSVERSTPFLPREREMLGTIAAQVAVALRTAGAIERLTEEHLVRELFDAIAAGHGAQAVARLRSSRVDAEAPHVVVVLEPLDSGGAWTAGERLEARLRHLAPGALCDPGPERLQVLLRVPPGETREAGLRALDAELDALAREEGAVAGRSRVQPQLAADRSSLVEAAAAARIARALAPGGGARAWEHLGAYRYLVGVDGEVEPDARHARAIDALWRYDERRGSELVGTLERYLADRSVVPTARALRIHANTLRQRLERIEHLTDLVIAEEDLVSLELAVKLHRLRAPERRDAA